MYSVFVPIYNEEKIAPNNLVSIIRSMRSTKKKFEIYAVNDGSKDNTESVVRKLMEEYPELECLSYSNGPSRRENLGKAFQKAKGDYIIFMDVDLATDLSYLPKLIDKLEQGYDIVIGSRYKGIKAKRTVSRFAISRIYNLFMRLYFGSKILDHQCGFKGFSKQKLNRLLDNLGYDKHFVRGWFWDVELLLLAQKARYRIYELPVKWTKGESSSFDIKRELRMLSYIFSIRHKLV
jgi:glycosyltransferase AglD